MAYGFPNGSHQTEGRRAPEIDTGQRLRGPQRTSRRPSRCEEMGHVAGRVPGPIARPLRSESCGQTTNKGSLLFQDGGNGSQRISVARTTNI